MATRDDIAKGPQFEKNRDPLSYCAACREQGMLDIHTGLCLPCWRVWRFAKNDEDDWAIDTW